VGGRSIETAPPSAEVLGSVGVVMGQTVSVDRDAIDLRDLFCFDQASSQQFFSGGSTKPADACCARHHVKAWKFEKSGQKVADSPATLCDEHGVFIGELQKTCSYLILHVATARSSIDSTASDRSTTGAALEELASRANGVCTPRGLSIEVTPQSEAVSIDGRPGTSIRYSVFVWHGLDVDPHVKVRSLTKAFELERLLRSGLVRCRGFGETLDRARVLKGARIPTPQGTRFCSAALGNRLLASILGGNDSASAGSQDTKPSLFAVTSNGLVGVDGCSTNDRLHSAAGGVGQRFPRLGLSVCRSLGVKPVAADAWSPENRHVPSQQRAASPMRPVAVVPLALSGVARLGSDSAIGNSETQPRRVAPLVPRLQLGMALGNPPHNEASSMEVDGGLDSDSGGRKRTRGPDLMPPQTARISAPAARIGVGTSTGSSMVPKSARTNGAMQGVGIPGLNLGQVTHRHNTNPVAARTDPPVMLNLEEINMSEEELINSYDPENEENNYHLPQHLYKHLQLKQFRGVASEIVEKQLYLSSYQVASDLETLKRHEITHVVNTAGDVCESKYPDHFQYLTFYLKDINSEDIQLLFYKTIEWINAATSRGGRVLVHCHAGVSRSSTIILSYIMWRFKLSFEQAHDRVRKVRPICNPNTGFTCQLLLHAKKLGLVGANGQVAPPYERPPAIYRVTPYHPKEPFLFLQPTESSASSPWPLFDPRFGWVAARGAKLVLWLGSQVPDKEAVLAAVSQHARWLQTFERCSCSIVVVNEGAETVELWQAIGIQDGERRTGLAAPRQCYDADYEIVVSSRSCKEPSQ